MTDDDRDEIDALALELRRLRAAEAPGSDDEALAPWVRYGAGWAHIPSGLTVVASRNGWSTFVPGGAYVGAIPADFPIALDAMRAAVPGSV